jgi:hypothetical protein
MNPRGSGSGAIKELLGRILLYHKEYECEVLDNTDTENRGRVQVAIPEFGMDSKENGLWVAPEYHHNQITPIAGCYVLVRFLKGDISRGIYRGRSGRVKANVPKAYQEPNTVVLFEDDGEEPLTATFLRKEKILEIKKGEDWNFTFNIENQVKEESIGDAWSNKTDYKNKKIDMTMSNIELHTDDTEVLLKAGNLQMHIKNDKIFIGNNIKGLTEILTAFMNTVKSMKTVGSPGQHIVSADDIVKIEQSINDTQSLLGDS